MKEHYYSNFKGCLGPRRPRTARSSPFRWISRFHLGTPFGLRSPSPAHPAHPSDTRPLKFQIRRLTGLSTQLVALCYFFYLSKQRVAPHFNKKRIVFFEITLNRACLHSYSRKINSEKSQERGEKRPKRCLSTYFIK